jgi:gamma-tubulin complex component 5
MEAFADALDSETKAFDFWCAEREEALLSGNSKEEVSAVVASLLGLENDVQRAWFSTFEILLEIINSISPSSERKEAPARSTSTLLNVLFSFLQEGASKDSVVLRVFTRSVEPLWDMIGRWMKDGMGGTTLEEEFFIIQGLSGGMGDPGFWQEGYRLRRYYQEDDEDEDVPGFLEHVVEPILECGKGVGLLKALGGSSVSLSPDDIGFQWESFSDLLYSSSSSSHLSVDSDTLSRIIYDHSSPYTHQVGINVVKAITIECELWKHLQGMQDLFFMRRGDLMSWFCETLFAKVRFFSIQIWIEFDDTIRWMPVEPNGWTSIP